MTSGKSSPWFIRRALPTDLDAIKRIADSRKNELGFVLRPTLAESIARDELLVAEEDGQVVGFVDFHLRRDRQLTLYHIATAVNRQRGGVGRGLLAALSAMGRDRDASRIMLKCPVDLEANQFYSALGFTLHETQNGRKRALNLWTLELNGDPAN